ncbi:MAG: response regulator, partial [Candidatus Competibacteraceae bacterium]|nr:response regulator [Candidatus Competibacteraceae bacterium]
IEGKGSVFSFRIKVKVKHDEPVIDNRVEIGDVEYISFLRKNAQKYQCLVVEDNIGNQEVITEVLNLINATFEIVENGEDAVDAYLKERYDLVLMDIQMPVMDGLEATRQIRKISDSNNDPYIIALTANAFEEDVKRSIEAGMNIHVSKPITFNDLIKPMYDFVKTLI